MDIEFRNIHIDMLAIPLEIQRAPLNDVELKLYQDFDEQCSINQGVVLVNRKKTGLRYEVVYGFEVIRAAHKAMIEYIPCLVCEAFSDLFIDLIRSRSIDTNANQHTTPEDVVAQAIETYTFLKGTKLSFRKAETIGKLGKKSSIYTHKRLAQNLHPYVQKMLSNGDLSKSAARSISYINFDEQYEFALKAIKNHWTVRDIDLERSKSGDAPIDSSMKSDIDNFQQQLEDLWGGAINVTPKTKNTGSVFFEFYHLEDVMTLCDRLLKMTTELSYEVKGMHKRNASGQAGRFEVKYKDLDTLEQLKKVLEEFPASSLAG